MSEVNKNEGVKNSKYSIVFALTESQLNDLLNLFKEQWWSKHRTFDDTKTIITESDIIIGITIKTSQLVGFVRVLTDFVDIAVIYDVILHRNYQKQGLGTMLMHQVKQHPKLQSIRYFDLFCKPEMNVFYQKFGFDTPQTGTNMLRLKQNEHTVIR